MRVEKCKWEGRAGNVYGEWSACGTIWCGLLIIISVICFGREDKKRNSRDSLFPDGELSPLET